jgi:hypothetical protein
MQLNKHFFSEKRKVSYGAENLIGMSVCSSEASFGISLGAICIILLQA